MDQLSLPEKMSPKDEKNMISSEFILHTDDISLIP
jgi:hypothetical protein